MFMSLFVFIKVKYVYMYIEGLVTSCVVQLAEEGMW